jgi:hypothetical protein
MRILNNYIVEGRKEGKGRKRIKSNQIKSNQIKSNQIESNQINRSTRALNNTCCKEKEI